MIQNFFEHTTLDLRSGRQSWRVRIILGSFALGVALLNVCLPPII